MKVNLEALQRRLRQVRSDLLYWSQRARLYRNTNFPHSAHKRKVERKVTALIEEEAALMEQLGELNEDVTYLPPCEQFTPLRKGNWKSRKASFNVGDTKS